MLVGTDDKYSVRILVKENVLDRMHFGFGRNNLHFLPRRHACFLADRSYRSCLVLGLVARSPFNFTNSRVATTVKKSEVHQQS